MYKSGESAVNVMPNVAASAKTSDNIFMLVLFRGAASAGSSVLDNVSFFHSGIVTIPNAIPYIIDTIILNTIV